MFDESTDVEIFWSIWLRYNLCPVNWVLLIGSLINFNSWGTGEATAIIKLQNIFFACKASSRLFAEPLCLHHPDPS